MLGKGTDEPSLAALPSWRAWLLYSVVCVVGLCAVFHVGLLSGFELQQPDPGDPRLVNYVLERNHQWFAGERPGEPFWSPPFFYPWPKVGTHTESMVGLQPFYSPWRTFGLSPETAYSLCGFGLLAACFACATWFFRAGAGLSPLAASAGGFLFAFALPRSAHLGHFQLFAHYATPLALLAVVAIVRSTAAGTPRRLPIWLLALTGWLQLLGSVYLVWFLCFLLALAGSGALFWPSSRAILWRLLRERWGTWLAAALLVGLAAAPVVGPYLDAETRIRSTSFERLQPLLPGWRSLFYPGPDSWESRMLGLQPPPGTPSRFASSQVLSPGYLTLGFALAGLWLGRRRPLIRWATGVAAVALGLTLVWPGGFTAWEVLHRILPGAEAVRGVSRIILPLLLVTGIGVAVAIEGLARRHRGLAWGAFLLLALEQGQTQRAFAVQPIVETSQRIARSLSAECDSFFYSVLSESPQPPAFHHLEAMWAGLFADRPTVNGYSGYPPRGWGSIVGPFQKGEVGPEELPRLATRLEARGAAPGHLCWLVLDRTGSSERLRVSMTPAPGAGEAGSVATRGMNSEHRRPE
jgi:hypothetical protein